MTFLVRIGNRYYFNRRVPEEAQEYDSRKLIRVSLKTDSKAQAQRRAIIYNEQVEVYWQSLVSEKTPHDNCRFKKAILIARQMGFAYQPMAAIATQPIQELLERILVLRDASSKQVEAVLGAKAEPEITVRDALEKFWALAKDKVINKSELQVKKWQNPRRKAVENFIGLIGNKNLKEITRNHIVEFRDWWINRIKNDGKNEDSANKNLMQLKCILETVSDHEKLGIDIDHLFKKVKLKTRFKQTRLPFTPDQIRGILDSKKLQNLNEEARWFLFAMSETGARPTEIVGLKPEDIRLNVEIPHIAIVDRKERPLKTPHSQREIPLVGYALEAFKALPNGFPRYRDRPDSLTTTVNKFLRDNELLPSKQHSVYSLRHSFQDRILGAKALDRVQAELMGHKFVRPNYGDGASLADKLECLEMTMIKQ